VASLNHSADRGSVSNRRNFACSYILGYSINTLTSSACSCWRSVSWSTMRSSWSKNVERFIEHGLTPREAAHHGQMKSQDERWPSRLCSAALSLFRWGVSLRASWLIPTSICSDDWRSPRSSPDHNSLTLSRRLLAKLYRTPAPKKDWLLAGSIGTFRFVFPPFKPLFKRSSEAYQVAVGGASACRGAACFCCLVSSAGIDLRSFQTVCLAAHSRPKTSCTSFGGAKLRRRVTSAYRHVLRQMIRAAHEVDGWTIPAMSDTTLADCKHPNLANFL